MNWHTYHWGKLHTGSSRFNRATIITFLEVYATNTESPTLFQLLYDSHIPKSLHNEHGKPQIQTWYGSHVPKSLR